MGFYRKATKALKGGIPSPGNKFFIGSTTHDISVTGDQVITGVGFPIATIIIYAVVNSSKLWSTGYYTPGGGSQCLYSQNAAAIGTMANAGTYPIWLMTNGSLYARARIMSVEQDGFTLTWYKLGLPTGTAQIRFAAFKR